MVFGPWNEQKGIALNVSSPGPLGKATAISCFKWKCNFRRKGQQHYSRHTETYSSPTGPLFAWMAPELAESTERSFSMKKAGRKWVCVVAFAHCSDTVHLSKVIILMIVGEKLATEDWGSGSENSNFSLVEDIAFLNKWTQNNKTHHNSLDTIFYCF